MRPRVFPAEDISGMFKSDEQKAASMRPRVFPAEDDLRGQPLHHRQEASMRPRVFPAEDRSDQSQANGDAYSPGFNEAAGIPRGRLPPSG